MRWAAVVVAVLGCGGAPSVRESPPEPTCGILRAFDRQESAIAEARGAPTFFWETEFSGRRCRVLLYGTPRALGVDLAIYECGKATYEATIDPALPCWRLAEVAPRVREQIEYFTRQPLGRQWEIVAGIPSQGQTPGDVHIAFGDPFNVLYKRNEEGAEVQTQIFLDRSGESFGLDVTLIEARVVGWRIRSRRETIPDAEARRARAVQAGEASSLEAAAAAAARRHEETIDYLRSVTDGRERMRRSLVTPPGL